jgi:hypothetical protein
MVASNFLTSTNNLWAMHRQRRGSECKVSMTSHNNILKLILYKHTNMEFCTHSYTSITVALIVLRCFPFEHLVHIIPPPHPLLPHYLVFMCKNLFRYLTFNDMKAIWTEAYRYIGYSTSHFIWFIQI